MEIMQYVFWVLVVKFAMLVGHTNLSPSPIDPKFTTMVMDYMCTW
jgi:hypothetical protein